MSNSSTTFTATTKLLLTATRNYCFITTTTAKSSLTYCHRRTFTTVSAAASSRLVPNPPDLIKWVRREGGFVHQAVKISQLDDYNGFGLVAAEDIPKGSELIALPDHVPLQFGSVEANDGDAAFAALVNLARKVPD